jgi:hypothetical protein
MYSCRCNSACVLYMAIIILVRHYYSTTYPTACLCGINDTSLNYREKKFSQVFVATKQEVLLAVLAAVKQLTCFQKCPDVW